MQRPSKVMKKLAILSLAQLAGQFCASAALTDNVVAYYNFEGTGSGGVANQIPGATTHNGTFTTALSNGAGPGFAGDAAFPGAEAANTTNRSDTLVGNALNVVKSDAGNGAGSGWFNVSTLTNSLGPDFSISAWFFLAPDADNTGTSGDLLRDFVFESTPNTQFDVSFGTSDANGTTYNSYVGGAGPAAVSPAGANNLAAGQWHNVVHVFSEEGTNTRLTVYLNGVSVSSSTAPTANMDFSGINFGANRGGIRIFDGMLDEVAVWDRSLTAAEATEIHIRGNNGTPLFGDDLAISLAVSPSGGGTVTGSGIYSPNATVSISAAANPGYVFWEWTGDFAGQPASFSHTVTANVAATAVFDQDLADSDGDGLSNYAEAVVHLTLPDNPDTDGDRIPDGAEVQTTLTDPKASDADLVAFVEENLCANEHAGAIALSPLRIERNPSTGVISLFLKLQGSADQSSWQAIDFSDPAASIVPAGNDWNLTFPAPSDTVNSYILTGPRP